MTIYIREPITYRSGTNHISFRDQSHIVIDDKSYREIEASKSGTDHLAYAYVNPAPCSPIPGGSMQDSAAKPKERRKVWSRGKNQGEITNGEAGERGGAGSSLSCLLSGWRRCLA